MKWVRKLQKLFQKPKIVRGHLQIRDKKNLNPDLEVDKKNIMLKEMWVGKIDSPLLLIVKINSMTDIDEMKVIESQTIIYPRKKHTEKLKCAHNFKR